MYFLYRILSEGFIFTGVICFLICVTMLPAGDWNILIGGVLMLLLFGAQFLVNRTKYVKSLHERVLPK